MIISAWLILLALFYMLFSKLLDEQQNPNQNVAGSISEAGIREVVLKRNRQGHYVATGKINGVPVNFLVDTGATDVAISEQLANKLGVEKLGGSFSQTASGVIAVWQGNLRSISLGPIEMQDVRASILPDSGINQKALLGMSFLKRLELIQKNGTLTMRQSP